MSAGYQIAQSGHSIAEFAHKLPKQFNEWIVNSSYLITLSIDNEESLKELFDKLKFSGINVVAFYEPDINNQMTSICFMSNHISDRFTRKLKLSLN